MKYSKEQLIEALYREYVFLCHDDFDPDVAASTSVLMRPTVEFTNTSALQVAITKYLFERESYGFQNR